MTTDTAPDPDFTTVALAFLDERDRRGGDTLARYSARYPLYARDLTALAFETAAAEGQSIAPAMSPTISAATASPPAHVLARLREDARAALLPGANAALTSLLARGRARAGLAPRALARRLEIGVDVLALLEERHVTPGTVARPFLTRLAGVLETSVAAVQQYLAAPPPAAARGVAYHAPRGHTPARQIAFTEAIAGSNLTTPEQKARWLAPDDADDADAT